MRVFTGLPLIFLIFSSIFEISGFETVFVSTLLVIGFFPNTLILVFDWLLGYKLSDEAERFLRLWFDVFLYKVLLILVSVLYGAFVKTGLFFELVALLGFFVGKGLGFLIG